MTLFPLENSGKNSSCSGSFDKYQNLERDKIELRVKQENSETEQRLEKERRALLDEKQAAFEKERLVRLEEHHRLRAEVENVERLLDWRAGIRCDCCGFQGSSEADFLRHCRGKSHKRKGGSPPPVDGSTSTTSTSTPSCASSASAPVHSLLEFKLDLGEIRGASNHWHAKRNWLRWCLSCYV